MIVWILISLLIIFFVWMVFVYNRLVSLRNEVRSAWSQIDVQLKRRHDLIPNLVSVVKGYMEFERETFERVISARAKAMSAAGFRERVIAENRLTQAVSGFFAVAENYPVLKSIESVTELMEELVSTENRIAFARQFYNDLVANYITKQEIFPDNIIASAFSFQRPEYFSAGDNDRIIPKTQMNVNAK